MRTVEHEPTTSKIRFTQTPARVQRKRATTARKEKRRRRVMLHTSHTGCADENDDDAPADDDDSKRRIGVFAELIQPRAITTQHEFRLSSPRCGGGESRHGVVCVTCSGGCWQQSSLSVQMNILVR